MLHLFCHSSETFIFNKRPSTFYRRNVQKKQQTMITMISNTTTSASRRQSISIGRYLTLPKFNSFSPRPPNRAFSHHRPHRWLSTFPQQSGLTPEGEVVVADKGSATLPQHEVVRFPSSNPKQPIVVSNDSASKESVPVLLNSKEHAVGYLSKILNARVYDAAIETELQEAKNLSSVRYACLLFTFA